MATKKYTQFSQGAFDALRILLTADPSTGKLKKVNYSEFLGFKLWFGRIRQSGTAAPTELFSFNALGFSPVLSRFDVGQYRMTSAGNFPQDKTMSMMNSLSAIDVSPCCATALPDVSGDFLGILSGDYLNQTLQDDSLDHFLLIAIKL